MNRTQFTATLTQSEPPAGLTPLLEALWYAGRDEWHRAHAIAQDHEDDPTYNWLHACLHRQEGDQTNAAYWYRRAGRPVHTGSLRAEWEELVRTQLPQ
ncbi:MULTISPECIES: hypothetical protein [Hymenobacter]|uniref:Uncharacterized protein n=1 Tax=Hymenobacter profundi TaxID=1982110 RepID=A0ABS6X7T7_9BACT|nr:MULTISPECIES: hypothetical protein [Hymenobacter]MBW3131068.1 hypothetical protein [Hymenobacter profundi]QNE40552.1 hypothetical protein F1C16_13765 [Hymenobacter sp. NBH84]